MANSTTNSDSDATISYSDSDGEPYFITDSGSETDENVNDNGVSNQLNHSV